MKEIDKQNTTKANATRDNTYKINLNKYNKHNPSKPITTNMIEKDTDKYEKWQTR